MRGTLLNTATVASGASLGLVVGNVLPPSYQQTVMSGIGLATALLAVKMFLSSKNVLVVIIAMAIGGLLGAVLHIASGMDGLAEWARQRLGGGSTFNEGLITTSVLFCVGPMTILGCLQDGLEGKIELLVIKSILDGVGAFFFAAALGSGVLVTAAVVLVFQGALTLAARPLKRIAEDGPMLDEITAVGGAMLLATALGLLEIKRLPTANYLPALAVAPLLVILTRRYPIGNS